MKFKRLLASSSAVIASFVFLTSAFAESHTTSILESVKAKGFLQCGVAVGVPGFAFTDDDGVYQGFDPSLCRAVAAAVLGDGNAVRFTPTTGKTRFTALGSGEIDMLARNTTWTFSRDVELGLTFTGTNYYDGQGFILRKDMGITSAKELDGATVCVQTGTTTELNLAEYFRVNNMSYEPLPIESNAEARTNYLAGSCDVYTTDISGLAATRSTLPDSDAHIILPEVISREPLSPAVRHGDDQWADIVRWTIYALVTAEEKGITQANVDSFVGTEDPEIARLLGIEGNLGSMFGLNRDWAKQAIASVGNYGEIFARYIGSETKVGLDRGLNALYTDGGLMYAPPFR